MASAQQNETERPSGVWKGNSAPIDLAAHLKRINEAPVLVEGKRRHPGVEGEVVGLDFNPALVVAAWEALPGFQDAVGSDKEKLSVEEGNVTAMQFPDQSFDGAYLTLIDAVSHMQGDSEDMDPGFVKAKALMEMTISKGILEPPRTCSSSSDRQRRWRLLPHQPALFLLGTAW
ncbi:uncharacterized protein ACA1_388170 [Acanthamoeba castellanii str. Neff]|uniref:Uncharacterized protein n=1 Tax=Acanthamoeba castellanii (strain ATCC 30010 / Neff) TaxID=1257118 RepID=L8GDR0_ACACF|nr:uncharacterized protein ACA1_388170 [Acanthamoeba castellanii str. Neff]ELR11157.1 hypothetical protein ACA1_388170 [Acanthamoeba castellanii str. Neff]